jgi:predicted ATPase
LNFQAEWLYEIEGLPYPGPDKLDIDTFNEFAAVKLFMERAERTRVRFRLSETDRQDIAHVCKLVEGMPLALELAASLVGSHTCRHIAQELENNIKLLATHMRDVPARHRSMQAVFEGSWEMLSVEEQCINEAIPLSGRFHRESSGLCGRCHGRYSSGLA